jgi:hypothetical protein
MTAGVGHDDSQWQAVGLSPMRETYFHNFYRLFER